MLILGWHTGANTIEAIRAIHKHTDLGLYTSKRIIEDVVEGNPQTVPDDFVLREELVRCNFIVK
jgi:hypothetical protein